MTNEYVVLGFVGVFFSFHHSCTLHFHIDGNDFKRHYVIAYKTWLIRYIPVPFDAQMTLPITFIFYLFEIPILRIQTLFDLEFNQNRTQTFPLSLIPIFLFLDIQIIIGDGKYI